MDVTDSNNEAAAVRALADILAEKEGRVFVLGLDRNHANCCIDVLGWVSRDLRLQPSFVVSDGLVRASLEKTSKPSQRSRLSSSR